MTKSVLRWIIWLSLLIVTGLTTWLVRDSQQDAQVTEVVGQEIADYVLKKFITKRLNPEGQLQEQLTADKMVHYRDKSTELSAPQMIFYRQGQLAWKVNAERGKIAPDGEQMWLYGATTLFWETPDSPKWIKILSQDIYVQLALEYAETKALTTILSADAEIHSVGAKVFMPTQRIELLSQVRGIYARPK